MATANATTSPVNIGGVSVPANAVPWVQNAAAKSTQGIPAAFFAYIMDRESDFRPGIFANDVNGGTWGLFQINAYEWKKASGGSFSSPNIKDPMIHTTYGAKYFDERLKTVRNLRAKNPTKPYATDLTELEALLIAHNSGEGNLAKYPGIPRITKDYLEEYRRKVGKLGVGIATGAAGAGQAIGSAVSNPMEVAKAAIESALAKLAEFLNLYLMVLIAVVLIIIGLAILARDQVTGAALNALTKGLTSKGNISKVKGAISKAVNDK